MYFNCHILCLNDANIQYGYEYSTRGITPATTEPMMILISVDLSAAVTTSFFCCKTIFLTHNQAFRSTRVHHQVLVGFVLLDLWIIVNVL